MQTGTAETHVRHVRPSGTSRFWTAAGVLAAVLASSCCIVPLLFVLLGIGGVWMSSLTALEPFKSYFLAGAVVFLGLGYRRVYFRPKTTCDVDGYCASPAAGRPTKVALWLASALVLLSATIDFWAPLFY